ncbi:MAG: substrate-binding domain-containing protein [Nitrospira sp.]|nr:substrate-binding domain-containing protein [Nitrospira sp.]
MKKTYLIITVIILLIGTLSMSAYSSDFAVIVNKANTGTIDNSQLKKIYTGDMTTWPGGAAITAVDLPEDNPVRKSFTSSALGKTVANIKALWAQKIFTGKGIPPRVVDTDDEVKKIVSGNKHAIGYIKSSNVDDTVQVVK